MIIELKAKGHENISSKHKTTFEITADKDMTVNGDCIIGVSSNKNMINFPDEFKKKIAIDNAVIKIELSTTNAYDEIIGYGNSKMALNHPTDIVCRKSSYICSRTLMINSNKASFDLNRTLINDLKNKDDLNIKIIV
jgi:hypothetical protein